MPRGVATQCKVIYQGNEDDYVCFIESIEILEKWKKDPSIPLAQVLNGWKIFCNHKQGAQGILDEASKAHLESEFGTSVDEEVIKQILTKGAPQTSTSQERQGVTNITPGAMVAH